MKRRFMEWGLLPVFIGVFLWGLNARYPFIGEDYFYVFPRLLEGKWHFLRQGFAPLRYAPHLCGGFPQYGNPQDHFYSLTQLFSLFLGLWTALQASVVITLLIGYAGWVRFGQDVLKLSRAWSHVLALVCIANGFYFLHLLVGHLWIISLPLLSWILWLMFMPARETVRTLFVRAISFGFITAYILYSGSQTLVLLTLMLLLALAPVDILLAERSRERCSTLLRRFAAFGIGALVLCSSKLVAVWSLLHTLNMKATFSGYHAGESIVLFVMKSFWAVPQSVGLYTPSTAFIRIHEESMYTAHIALLGCLALPFFFVRTRSLSIAKKTALALYVFVLVTFILLLVRGTGIVPETLQQFPLFSALRVPERFLYLVSLPVSLAGVWGASALASMLPKRIDKRLLCMGIGALTILGFAAAYVPLLLREPLNISLPYDVILASEQRSDGYLSSPVTHAFEPEGQRVSDFHYLFSASTGTQCYEAIPLALPKLRNGPVDMEYDGAFNIYNPSCLQYPEENNCKPKDRISTDDRENFLRFIHGLPVTWNVSALQTWADRLTLFALIAFPLSLLWLCHAGLLRFFVRLRTLLTQLFSSK
ncbi:hypothetical protein HZA87_03025 [Candidatus Uhrbacteria bacterium]|nr:hypothetical protein [Candidatus Uhrbacteria bacterium]